MEKDILEKLKGQCIKLSLKPNSFILTGVIDAVFEDCIQFTTRQQTSYIDIDTIGAIIPLRGR
jgi:ubiquinone biosynthesis protein UbiJ